MVLRTLYQEYTVPTYTAPWQKSTYGDIYFWVLTQPIHVSDMQNTLNSTHEEGLEMHDVGIKIDGSEAATESMSPPYADLCHGVIVPFTVSRLVPLYTQIPF